MILCSRSVQVVTSSNVQILQRGKMLRLVKAATANAGRYSCKAINVAGNTEKAFHLDVLGESTHWSLTETGSIVQCREGKFGFFEM